MIEEVKDLMEDVKDKVGDKGFTAIMVVLVAVGVYLVYRSFAGANTSDYETVAVTGYPTVPENADVVMDNVNNTITGAVNEMTSRLDFIESIIGELDTEVKNTTEHINSTVEQSTASNSAELDRINSQLQEQQALLQAQEEKFRHQLRQQEMQQNELLRQAEQSRIHAEEMARRNREETEKALAQAKAQSQVDNASNKSQTYTQNKTTTTQKPTTNVYTYKTQSGLNTNTSIVDALKATGADSSFASRQAIAKANGISNYTGTHQQNVTLLNKLKGGTLKKA